MELIEKKCDDCGDACPASADNQPLVREIFAIQTSNSQCVEALLKKGIKTCKKCLGQVLSRDFPS